MTTRGGRAEQELRNKCRRRDHDRNAECWLCSQPIDYTLPPGHPDAWSPDHEIPVSAAPHLRLDPTNIRPAHLTCNQSRGNRTPTLLGTTSRTW